MISLLSPSVARALADERLRAASERQRALDGVRRPRLERRARAWRRALVRASLLMARRTDAANRRSA
jgi:hypothetical protein